MSPCCGFPIYDSWGQKLCSSCWQTVDQPAQIKQRDLITWLFPPETQPRIEGETVFLRYGKRLTVASKTRGRPDAWFWSDA